MLFFPVTGILAPQALMRSRGYSILCVCVCVPARVLCETTLTGTGAKGELLSSCSSQPASVPQGYPSPLGRHHTEHIQLSQFHNMAEGESGWG